MQQDKTEVESGARFFLPLQLRKIGEVYLHRLHLYPRSGRAALVNDRRASARKGHARGMIVVFQSDGFLSIHGRDEQSARGSGAASDAAAITQRQEALLIKAHLEKPRLRA